MIYSATQVGCPDAGSHRAWPGCPRPQDDAGQVPSAGDRRHQQGPTSSGRRLKPQGLHPRRAQRQETHTLNQKASKRSFESGIDHSKIVR